MAADHESVRFTHFRPCIDLHGGQVKQVCCKKHKLGANYQTLPVASARCTVYPTFFLPRRMGNLYAFPSISLCSVSARLLVER